jgi:hypothetical protein
VKTLHLAAVGAILSAGAAIAPAHATFVLDTSCGQSMCNAGDKMFIDIANKDVSTFTNHVGSELITADTTGNVDTGSGFATIKPIKGGTLTDLIFTPQDDTAFSDFSFRGQVSPNNFNGDINVIWTDSSGNTGTVPFTVSKPNADFNRLGIVSNDGETLKSVEVETLTGGSFKEFKQVEFSFATPPPPVSEPATLALVGTGLVGLGLARRRRKA